MRVVVTLTTMPDQYSKVIKTLESLHKQTYKLSAIYLSLPNISRRLGITYPPIPNEISNLCTVVPCIDYGPITKLSGGLLMENDPFTIIISCDNDMIYAPRMVEELIIHHKKYPNSALGSSGMLLKYKCPICAITPNENNFLYRISKFFIPVNGRRVDSLYGYPGALYIRRFFPEKKLLEKNFFDYALITPETLLNDDIIISGYLSLYNIERRILPNMSEVNFVLELGTRKRNESEISYNMDKFFQRMNLAIDTAKSIGMYSLTEPVDVSETIFGVSAIIILSVLIIIIICIYILKTPDYY